MAPPSRRASGNDRGREERARGETVRVASLYTFPTHRSQGIARAALEQLRDALGRRGRGLRLETNWNWQKTVGFYLHLGMWLRDWKRDLVFWWAPELPPRRIEVGERHASHSGTGVSELGGVRGEVEGPNAQWIRTKLMTNPAEDAAVDVAVRRAAENLGVAPQTLRVLSAIKRRRRSRMSDSAKVGWYFVVTIEAATGTQLTFRVFDSGEVAGPG